MSKSRLKATITLWTEKYTYWLLELFHLRTRDRGCFLPQRLPGQQLQLEQSPPAAASAGDTAADRRPLWNRSLSLIHKYTTPDYIHQKPTCNRLTLRVPFASYKKWVNYEVFPFQDFSKVRRWQHPHDSSQPCVFSPRDRTPAKGYRQSHGTKTYMKTKHPNT